MKNSMPKISLFLTCAVALFSSAQNPVFAQNTPSEFGYCILAGRISGFGKWAPRLTHLELVDAKGQQVLDESSEAQASVTHVRVGAATLLVPCNRDKPGAKAETGASVPAISAGQELIAVKTLSLVPVGIGGHWVELELTSAQARVVRIAPPAN
jgi:hypothetical protein